LAERKQTMKVAKKKFDPGAYARGLSGNARRFARRQQHA
jgi:hypothetical protein